MDLRWSTKPEVLQKMTEALAHRGPDGHGEYWASKETCGAQLGLGHRRLAVLDLTDEGHQPMQSASERYVITYNGEIYNHLEIRDQIDSSYGGNHWRGTSDTETLLAAIELWGLEDTLAKLSGMFAFGLWDKKDEKLYLARDRIGVKPLYYYAHDGIFLFASELKSFHQHPQFRNNRALDNASLALYLQHQYIPAPWCIFKNCYKVEAGCWIKFDQVFGRQKSRCYWSVPSRFLQAKSLLTEEEALEELEDHLAGAVKKRLISDVPVAG